MRKHFTLFILLIAYSCKAPVKNTDPLDTIIVTQKTASKTKSQAANKGGNKLIGTWTDGSSENATFKIKEDSIYYLDSPATYKYSLKKDSIKIYYDDFTFSAKIHFVKDTMMMNSPDYGTSKYWRFKND